MRDVCPCEVDETSTSNQEKETMFRKALITMAVLGATSTAALARPIISADVNVGASWSAGVDVRDHRYDTTPTYTQQPAFRPIRSARRFQVRPRYENRLVMLSEINRMSDPRPGASVGRAFVNLQGARASTLAIQATGPIFVNEIAVEYYNSIGALQTMKIMPRVRLDRFNTSYSFDLGGNVSINRVIVYGTNGSYDAGFSLLGR
jgi:hypothetical protein